MLGKGKAQAISDADIANLADRLRCHPADLEAISIVESGGFGWFRDGRIKILFEKHWMYKLTPVADQPRAIAAGVARKGWISPKNGGYKDQATAGQRYIILEKAIQIARAAGFSSVSIGKYQIMGFNWQICGFASAEQMFFLFTESEVHQLKAFSNFLIAKNLVKSIQARDFDRIETIYNGGGLGGAYARKMRVQSDTLRAGKWAGYSPGDYGHVPETPIDDAQPKPEITDQTPEAPKQTVAQLFAQFFVWVGTIISNLNRGQK